MSGIKVIRNGNPKEDDIVFSRVLRWLGGVGSVVFAGLLLAGIVGLFQNAIVTRENNRAIKDLTSKVDALVEANRQQWEQARVEREALRIGQEAVKRRLTLIDKKID